MEERPYGIAPEKLTPISEIPLEDAPAEAPPRGEVRRIAPAAPRAKPRLSDRTVELEVHPGDLLKFAGLGLLGLFVILGALCSMGTFQSFLHIAPEQRGWAFVGGFLLALGGVVLFGLFWGLGEVIRLLQILTAEARRSD